MGYTQLEWKGARKAVLNCGGTMVKCAKDNCEVS